MNLQQHVLVCGEVGVGKSTIIEKLLRHNDRPVYGFITKRLGRDKSDANRIYIHAANTENRTYTAQNIIGTCGASNAQGYPETFDSIGVTLLNAPPEGLLLMDELGFLENKARVFCMKVLQALDGDIPILAAVKTRETPFLKMVREHNNARLFNITRENRDVLYYKILPQILSWNDKLQDCFNPIIKHWKLH